MLVVLRKPSRMPRVAASALAGPRLPMKAPGSAERSSTAPVRSSTVTIALLGTAPSSSSPIFNRSTGSASRPAVVPVLSRTGKVWIDTQRPVATPSSASAAKNCSRRKPSVNHADSATWLAGGGFDSDVHTSLAWRSRNPSVTNSGCRLRYSPSVWPQKFGSSARAARRSASRARMASLRRR